MPSRDSCAMVAGMTVAIKTGKAPSIVERPSELMAVVTTHGDPNEVGHDAISALYGAVYTLKFARKKSGSGDFKVQPLRARWPDLPDTPKDAWTGMWALPVPAGTTELPQKAADIEVRLERWDYGPVAEVLHTGGFDDEHTTVERLHAFVDEAGYEITGPHEEEYLTTPRAKVQRVVIRYPVRRRG